MNAARMLKRIALGATCVALPIALTAAYLLLTPPGAEKEAKRFGKSVRGKISDADLLAWAERVASIPEPEIARHAQQSKHLVDHSTGENDIDLPRTNWPPALKALLAGNQFATATLCRDRFSKPLGIRFRDGIVGVIIPLNGAIPDAAYFSIHMVDPACPYYAYSLYK